MRLRIAVTDNNWFRYLRRQPDVDEINFWQSSGERVFLALKPAGLLLSKLPYP
jgi:putative restriction endonuclease